MYKRKEKPSKYMSKLARINIIKKTKRTYLSMVAVGLSTAIIFSSLTLFITLFQFSSHSWQSQYGNYHYATHFEKEGPELSKNYLYTKDINTNLYGSFQNEVFNIRTLQFSNTAILPFELIEGSYPQTEDELLVSSDWHLNVGDRINCEILTYSPQTTNEHLYPQTFPQNSENSKLTQNFVIVGIYQTNEAFVSLTNHQTICYSNIQGSGDEVYYVKDLFIYHPDSFKTFQEKTEITGEDIFNNEPMIQKDKINAYLENKYSIFAIFFFVALLSFMISLISIQNVILISDKDRKKELGLLKSIGASPLDIKKMLSVELFILGALGSFAGLILGILTSYFILQQLMPVLEIEMDWRNYFQPISMGISFIIGLVLMVVSGFHSYKPYLYSLPLDDLKNQVYQYEPPKEKKEVVPESFQWKMFILYNARMRQQTRNLRRAFILLLTCTTLFSCIFLANMIYKNNFKDKHYDIDITNVISDGTSNRPVPIDLDLLYGLTQKMDESIIDVKEVEIERVSLFIQEIEIHKSEKNKAYFDHVLETGQYYNCTFDMNTGEVSAINSQFEQQFLDQSQLKELEPYIVSGNFENMQTDDVIIVYISDDKVGELFQSCYQINDTIDANMPLKVKAYVKLPHDEETLKKLRIYRSYENMIEELWKYSHDGSNRFFIQSLEANLNELNSTGCTEHIYLTLKNQLDAPCVEAEINEILGKHKLTNVASIIQINTFSTFMIEVLIYPLFLLLFISALINIWHVFIGNIYLKRQDISILKTVGMTNQQLYQMLTFEYIEGYTGACLISSLIIIILSLTMKLIDFILKNGLNITFSASLDITANLMGALILSLALLGAILVIPVAIISLRNVKVIQPIENIKNMS